MNKGSTIFLAPLVFFAAVLCISAQQPTPTPSDFNSDTSKDDILILVNITAKELRFDAVPNTAVEFPGSRHRSTIWVTQRQNLPDQVQPGVTYRNIGIQLRIASRFADIERIVSEALGEIPVTDGSASNTVPTESAAPQPTTLQPAEEPKVSPPPSRVRDRRRPGRK